MQMKSNELYTVDEVATHFKVHKNTVLRLLRLGTLKSIQVGRQHRITGKSVIKLMGGVM